MIPERIRKGIKSISSLGDPVRRSLYEALAEEGTELSRDQLAKRTGIARPLAAYHLERLLKGGLLRARYERPYGRSGPGAGRPTKLYSRSKVPVQVSLPHRDYELAAHVLAEAVSKNQTAIRPSVIEVARVTGRQWASHEVSLFATQGEIATPREALRELGYEPVTEEGGMTWLRNCIFERLATEHREVICQMNQAFIEGLLSAFPPTGTQPSLQPDPNRCCVVLSVDQT